MMIDIHCAWRGTHEVYATDAQIDLIDKNPEKTPLGVGCAYVQPRKLHIATKY
jgi:hypothetical protein